MVLENPEVAVEPDIDAGRLYQVRRVRLHRDPACADLSSDVAVREQHGRNVSGRFGRPWSVGPASDLEPVVADGHDGTFADSHPLPHPALRRYTAACRDRGSVGGAAVDHECSVTVRRNREVRLGNGTGLISDLDQLCILLAGLRMGISAQQHQARDVNLTPVIQHGVPTRLTVGPGRFRYGNRRRNPSDGTRLALRWSVT